MRYAVAYFAAAISFLALDAVWLGVVAKDFYFSQLDGLIRDKPNVVAATVFYAGYIAGVVYFAVAPALPDGGLSKAVSKGALAGLFAYGTYDLTNLAVLDGYPAAIAIVDISWGMIATASASGVGYLAAKRRDQRSYRRKV